jgi:hypothetical protein
MTQALRFSYPMGLAVLRTRLGSQLTSRGLSICSWIVPTVIFRGCQPTNDIATSNMPVLVLQLYE